MNFQRISFVDFWGRYGHQEFEVTELALALDRLPDISPEGPWLAGGSVRRLVARQPQDSDFDFFFRDQAQFDAFCDDMAKRGARRSSEGDFNVTFMLPAVQAKPIADDEFTKAGPELKVQAIRIAFFETLNATLESFDFSITQFGYDGTDFLFGQWSLFDLASKRLVPGKLTYGTSSLRRIIKYTRQGFTICGGGLADVLEQVVNDPSIIQRDVEYVD